MGGGSSTQSGSEPAAGDGIKSIRTTNVFKAVNFELYVKPVSRVYSENQQE